MSDYLKKHCEELIDEYKKSDAEKRQEIFPKIKTFYDFIENYDEEVKKHFDSVFSDIVFRETPKSEEGKSYNYNISDLLENETPENDFKLKYLLKFDDNEYNKKLWIYSPDKNYIDTEDIWELKNTYKVKLEKILNIIPDCCLIESDCWGICDPEYSFEEQKRLLEILSRGDNAEDFNKYFCQYVKIDGCYDKYIKDHYNYLKSEIIKSFISYADKGYLTEKNNTYIKILLAEKGDIKNNFLELFDEISEQGEYECLTVSFVNHLIDDYHSYKDILLEKNIDILKNYTFILSNVKNQRGFDGSMYFTENFDPNVLIPFIQIAKRDFDSIDTTNEINNIIEQLAIYYINCENETYTVDSYWGGEIMYHHKKSIDVLKELCEINDRDYCEVLDYMAELDPSFKNTPEYEQEYVGQQLKHF